VQLTVKTVGLVQFFAYSEEYSDLASYNSCIVFITEQIMPSGNIGNIVSLAKCSIECTLFASKPRHAVLMKRGRRQRAIDGSSNGFILMSLMTDCQWQDIDLQNLQALHNFPDTEPGEHPI
jgi:hypothetical protein